MFLCYFFPPLFLSYLCVKWREKPASASHLCHHMKEKLLCVRDLGSPGFRWVEGWVNAWRVHFARKTKAMWELKKRKASNYGVRCSDNSTMCIFRGYVTTVFSRNFFFSILHSFYHLFCRLYQVLDIRPCPPVKALHLILNKLLIHKIDHSVWERVNDLEPLLSAGGLMARQSHSRQQWGIDYNKH